VARRHGLALGRVRPVHVADVVRGDDLVVAVCDSAHEHLGQLPRRRLHWSVPDPAAADNDEAFEAAYTDLSARIDRLAPALTAGSSR
jgi:protein-tyrosine-phosphatase